MNEENIILFEGVEVPASTRLTPIRDTGYGHIEGLDDEELATPDELERMVYLQEFGPLLALPQPQRKSVIKPNIDENGRLDWGAFGTVDFDRVSGGFDKPRYQAERLSEQLKDKIIMFEMLSERIKSRSKSLILHYVRRGIIELEHITDEDLRALAKLNLQIRKLSSEIIRLRQDSQARKDRQFNKFLEGT